MGGAPGTVGLPTWGELTWQELPYPEQAREALSTYEEWGAYVDEMYRAAPLRTTPLDELPDKMLCLYFIWTIDGIKVRWKVSSGTDVKETPKEAIACNARIYCSKEGKWNANQNANNFRRTPEIQGL